MPFSVDLEFEKIKPKYLYSLVDSINVDFKRKLSFLIKGPCLLKIIMFVFLKFTCSFHFSQ